jgi:hypothetical protein
MPTIKLRYQQCGAMFYPRQKAFRLSPQRLSASGGTHWSKCFVIGTVHLLVANPDADLIVLTQRFHQSLAPQIPKREALLLDGYERRCYSGRWFWSFDDLHGCGVHPNYMCYKFYRNLQSPTVAGCRVLLDSIFDFYVPCKYTKLL